MVDKYRKRIARTVIEMAKDDPDLILSVVAESEAAGEIDAGDLNYLKRIARQWKEIAERNLKQK
jgi:hypothetical protein